MKEANRQTGYSVETITTDVEKLTCWHVDCDEEAILREAKAEGYSYIPVSEDGLIVGVLSVDALATGNRDYEKLGSRRLIAANTPILHLIELFAKEQGQHFFVLSSSRIIGMVTEADLNKVPARASVYLLVAHYEMLLTALIQQEIGETEEALRHYLSEASIEKARNTRNQERHEDLELPLIRYVNLFDLVEIIKKHDNLRKRLGFKSKNSVDVLKFETVRNATAHLNKLLIKTKADIRKINENCGKIITVSKKISELLDEKKDEV